MGDRILLGIHILDKRAKLVFCMVQEQEEILRKHEQLFGKAGRNFVAPARVNLIGEHTDYTGGLVMPMAIGFHTSAVISPRNDDRAVIYSANYGEQVILELDSLRRQPRGHWSDYPIGVVWSLLQEGIEIGGFNISLAGDVPLGAGLSSSASVEIATAAALLSHAKSSYLSRRFQIYVGAPKTNLSEQRAASWINSWLLELLRTGQCCSIVDR